jgi:hypothetical protein
MFKRVGPASLKLLENGSADIEIKIRIGPNNEWSAVAAFPLELAWDARDWIGLIETPNDLEDLIREFCDAGTWGSYQNFRDLNGF